VVIVPVRLEIGAAKGLDPALAADLAVGTAPGAALPAGPWSARLAPRVPVAVLRRAFAPCLLAIAARTGWRLVGWAARRERRRSRVGTPRCAARIETIPGLAPILRIIGAPPANNRSDRPGKARSLEGVSQ
jgi:uncharacterized membrane protein YfcA